VTTLQALLDDGRRFDAEYAGGLSNHLPMALVALKRLGADDEHLNAFATRYGHRLQAAPAAAPWPAGDPWPSRLGERAAWPAYRTLFAEWLDWEGAASVLSQVLPVLMPGCGAAAFHGLIRTAHALQAGHAGELADGLAYWACRWLPLGAAGPAPARRVRDPAVLLARMQRSMRQPLPERGLIFERLQDVAALPAFAPAVAALRVDSGSLERLARHAAQLYVGGGSFTVLHLVTSAHALRCIEAAGAGRAPLCGDYWPAYAAGVVASPPCDTTDAAAPWPWSALVAAAIASDDEHRIKLVDSCLEHERVYGAGPWQAAATRAFVGG
jgi:hypothetical protein